MMVSSMGGNVWDGKGCDDNGISTTMDVTPPIPVRPDWRIRTGFGVRNHIQGLLIFFSFFFFKAELISVVYK